MQLRRGLSGLGAALGGVNGDFYQREGSFAGDPRGLQILRGEVISAPSGGACFWTDALGEPHVGAVVSQFQVVLPGGGIHPVGVNCTRPSDSMVLYTSAIGGSTRTRGGREWVLRAAGTNEWRGLRVGRIQSVRMVEVRESGDTPVPADAWVLSAPTALARQLPKIEPGAELKVSTLTSPSLRGARTAIGGGPVLITGGARQRIDTSDTDAYQYSSMEERHPRAAVGWNDRHFFLVVVDGRQPGYSMGMTIAELAAYLSELGCTEAMNLDGGGSATMWYDGQVQNRPCDGLERPIANGLGVFRKASPASPRAGVSGAGAVGGAEGRPPQ